MNKIVIPDHFNYCSAFITFACNMSCSYCINKYNGLHKYKQMSAADWIKGLNRIQTRKDLPITITGGEPTVYPGFYELINGIDKKIPVDLLTNGLFDMDEFTSKIPPNRLKRDAKYASIRFSFHPGQTDAREIVLLAHAMGYHGYSVGIWAVDTGDDRITEARRLAGCYDVDFRMKEYLDATHGNYKYPDGLDGKRKKCLCKMSELLIAPDGRLFRCHHDLYHGINSYGHILDDKVNLPTDFLPCDNYGLCSPCDLKLKFDRFQELGHCSVTIKEQDEKE